MRHRAIVAGTVVVVAAITAGRVWGGAEKIEFPVSYRTEFVRYATVDREDRKPPIIRFLYVDPESLATARPGQPLPDGTVIVMEDHPAQLDGAGAPLVDANGRFVPASEVTNIFVQEKRTGWGTEYAPELRNGEWEYARFQPDGSRPTGENVKFDRCFECHKGVADQDFNFTLTPFVERLKGG